jgi:uncharacterized membrane protein
MSEEVRVAQNPSTWQPGSETVSRLLNFSDAIVAIAVTLLVLPLIDIEPPGEGETIWQVIAENSGQFTAFFLSFVITLVYWRRHHRMFDGLISFTPMLQLLNTAWLLLIVLFQFPTRMVGDSQDGGNGSATLYLVYLAAVGFMTMALAAYLTRHPELRSPEAYPLGSRVQFQWGVVTNVWILAAVASIWMGGNALWLLLGLFVIGRLEGRSVRAHRQA